jgi:guanine nucleotide-binding protein alpha-1 subunit
LYGLGDDDLPDEAAEVLVSCRDDIKAIWEDPVVREMLAKRKKRIEDGAGL